MPGARTVFEPKTLHRVPRGESVVVKKLIDHLDSDEYEVVGTYDRRLLIVRDPRDVIVSRMLYRIRDMDLPKKAVHLGHWLAIIRSKQERPRRISMLQMDGFLRRTPGGKEILSYVVYSYERLQSIMESLPPVHIVRYEDFVEGHVASSEAYLGLTIDHAVRVDADLSRVSRTHSSGDWRNWFTRSDIAWSNRELGRTLRAFGYPRRRWQPPTARITPEHSIWYVDRILREKFGDEVVDAGWERAERLAPSQIKRFLEEDPRRAGDGN